MADTPLNIKIVVDGANLTTGMSQAAATVEAATAKMNTSFSRVGPAWEEAMHEAAFSTREARESVRGLGEEIGVHIPRFVSTFISDLGGVGQALAFAFTPVAIIGFLGVLNELPDAIQKGSDKLVGFDTEAKKAYSDAIKQNLEYQKENVNLASKLREVALIGKEGPGRTALEMQLQAKSTAELSEFTGQLEKRIRDTEAAIKNHVSGLNIMGEVLKGQVTGSIAGTAIAMDKWLKETVSVDDLKKKLADLNAVLEETQKKLKFEAPVEKQKLAAEDALKNQELLNRTYDEGVEITKRGGEADLRHIEERMHLEDEAQRKLDEADKRNEEAQNREIRQTQSRYEEERRDAERVAAAKFATATASADHELALGRVTVRQATALKLGALQDEYTAEVNAIEKRVALLDDSDPDSPKMRAKLYAELLVLEQKYQADRLKIGTKAASAQQQMWGQAFTALNRTFDQAIQGLVTGTERFGNAFGRMLTDILSKFIQAMVRMGAQWLLTHVLMLVVKKSVHEQEVLMDAKAAAAAAWKAVVGIPIIGPILAPIAAATAFAGVEAFSAAGGWDVPGSIPSSGALTVIHPKEMVLPADVANSVRGGTRIGGPGSLAGSSSGGDIHLHYSPSVQAIDGRGIVAMLDQHSDHILQMITTAKRENRF